MIRYNLTVVDKHARNEHSCEAGSSHLTSNRARTSKGEKNLSLVYTEVEPGMENKKISKEEKQKTLETTNANALVATGTIITRKNLFVLEYRIIIKRRKLVAYSI